MNTLDKLIRSIKEKKQISFEYNKPGKTSGVRVGDPYAVFIFTAINGKKSTKVHIVQTEGVSDSLDKNDFPNFRTFNIEDLSNVTILDNTFKEIHPDYNPDWEDYSNIIEKI